MRVHGIGNRRNHEKNPLVFSLRDVPVLRGVVRSCWLPVAFAFACKSHLSGKSSPLFRILLFPVVSLDEVEEVSCRAHGTAVTAGRGGGIRIGRTSVVEAVSNLFHRGLVCGGAGLGGGRCACARRIGARPRENREGHKSSQQRAISFPQGALPPSRSSDWSSANVTTESWVVGLGSRVGREGLPKLGASVPLARAPRWTLIRPSVLVSKDCDDCI